MAKYCYMLIQIEVRKTLSLSLEMPESASKPGRAEHSSGFDAPHHGLDLESEHERDERRSFESIDREVGRLRSDVAPIVAQHNWQEAG